MTCCRKKHHGGEGHKGSHRRCRAWMFGALIGLFIGLILAPKPGAETIDALREKVIRKLPV